ncbi:LOW QUALITY PROTEIN: mas-related G-protein coupled receptor member B4-like [Peromyscus californicus insignis]|uniref:LOW QUALITY PROTEIN: mas-related G-protein coupled receptor member B4-like n=1 Tax=Peromyscus californicus insignis TaxID=564181 RepID=UPI0022A6AF5A|nr:LOW QUALITY PROTEIN: mas-related G-protein coupled receptor member B4-like [Peromyscus californicus insignis]
MNSHLQSNAGLAEYAHNSSAGDAETRGSLEFTGLLLSLRVPCSPGGLDSKYHVFISQFTCRNTSGTFSSMGPSTPTWSTDNTTMNESFYIIMSSSYYTESLLCVTMKKILSILTVIIAVFGLAGNAIVLWLLGFHMHRNAFSVYVLNLAGADFLFLCFQTVYSLERILISFHNSYLDIHFSLFNVLIFTYLAGMCMIAAISADRCLSILWPIWYHCQRPRYMSSVLCALLWAFSLLLSLLLGDGCGLLFSYYDHSLCRTYNFITATFVIVLSMVLCGSSLALLVRIFCGSQRIPVTRLYMTIALTVLVFLLFGLPFGIYWFLLDWIVELYRVFPCNVYAIITFLSCVNSCANPIIYFLVGSIRHRRFQRQTLKILLQRAMQDTPEEEGGERGSSGNPGEK